MRPTTHPSEWTDPRHRIGWEAELRAGTWLEGRGFEVLAHRYRLGRNDLDLIARKADLVAFVEVKLRRSIRAGFGEESVTRKKQRNIERLAWSWILKYGRSGDRYRFDVVTILGHPDTGHLVHLTDAWRPGWR
jgi:putative endonuclease